MRKALRNLTFALSILALTLSGIPTASAAGFNVTTRLSMRAPKVVQSGALFHIQGKLRSSQSYCRKRSVIVLYRNGESRIAKRTKKTGKYRFKLRARKTARYQVRFVGKTKGVHPNQQICGASQSKTKRVRVA